jgi:hypothetical protein
MYNKKRGRSIRFRNEILQHIVVGSTARKLQVSCHNPQPQQSPHYILLENLGFPNIVQKKQISQGGIARRSDPSMELQINTGQAHCYRPLLFLLQLIELIDLSIAFREDSFL